MHYYQFNIGDYKAHTAHLEPLEDLAYRRMLDWMYLHEQALPLDTQYVCKAIGMRTHSEEVVFVLSEFFQETKDGFINKRVMREVESFNAKSEKAKQSANARWKGSSKANANAMRTHSEGNAKHKTINNKHKTVIKPEGLPENLWVDFNKQRKTKLTQTALNGIIKQAQLAGWTLEQALTESVERGWQSFKAEWVNKPGKKEDKSLTDIIDGWYE